MNTALALLLLSISAFVAWRYARSDIDPDWSMFNQAAFCGALYGRDFVDCKTPFVHIYYYILARIVGTDVFRVRFANHFLVGSAGVLIYVLSGNFWNGLIFTIMVNSGWMFAFHGNVGQVPAVLVASALVLNNPPGSALLWLAAVAYEPKLVFSFGLVALFNGWWWLALLAIPALIIYLVSRDTEWFKWLWESSITLPARMHKRRQTFKQYEWWPWYTANMSLYGLMWLAPAIVARPDWRYWLPLAAYIAIMVYGWGFRPNHLIPIAAWVAAAGMPWQFALGLVIIEVISSGFYMGNVWLRWYPGLQPMVAVAREVGTFLRDKPGTVWVNGMNAAIYVWARKNIVYGMTEHIELAQTAHERREIFKQRFKANPPDWVVTCENSYKFTGSGYRQVAFTKGYDGVTIWRRIGY